MYTPKMRDEWLAALSEGKIRTVNAETHPFALGDDVERCGRCGVRVGSDEQAVYSAVAFVDEDRTFVHPLILVECEECSALPVEKRDLAFAVA
jgi:hypothetical protein